MKTRIISILWGLVIISTLSIQDVQGAQLSKDDQLETSQDFSGGLNTVAPAHKIQKSFSPGMRNVFSHRQPGKIVTRPGFTEAGSTMTLMSGRVGFTFYKESGDKEFIVSDDSMVLSTKDFNTYVFISSALNNTVHLNLVQIRNKVWFSNGVDSVFTWDGTTKQILDGTLGTPNVPKFRYLAGFQERVFGLNTSANASLLQWSDTASTAGAAIAPDSFLAWPIINGLNIGQGDGQNGSALWVYRSQLQIGKERSIYTLYGKNTSNYEARPTIKQVGVTSNESVVVLDNLSYFKGTDGIYSYDGAQAVRISDPIEPDVDAMSDATNLIRQNQWETQGDFKKGQVFGTTATVDGMVTLTSGRAYANHRATLDPTNFITLNSATPFTQWLVRVPSETFTGSIVYVDSITIPCRSVGSAVAMDLIVRNTRTLERMRLRKTVPLSATFDPVTWSRAEVENPVANPEPVYFTSDDLAANRFTMQITSITDFVGETFESYTPAVTGNADIVLFHATTGQFMSEVSTLNPVTAWSRFDSARNTNGGSIDYFFRSSTSSVNITTQVWTAITPGVVINAPTINNYVQWASTLQSVSQSSSLYPAIDNVTIEHIEGSGSRDRPFAVDWKNEFWLSVATETSGLFSLQYVKSWITNTNPHAWNPLQGINIRSLWKDGTSTLYGGSASTGTFYRLDFGTNDNGTAIDSYYEFPEFTLRGGWHGSAEEGGWLDKSLVELWLDADGSPGRTLSYGVSIDGAAYADTTVALNAQGRLLRTLYNPPGRSGKSFKLRVRNNVLDDALSVNGVGLVYSLELTR